MKIIIPIAGPDYFSKNLVKGLKKTSNGPLLKNVLTSRPWFNQIESENYIFIMQDNEKSRNFYNSHIKSWLPKAKAIFLSNITKGAAISAMMGIGYCIEEKQSPFILDLADIKFESKYVNFNKIFKEKNTDVFIYSFKNSKNFYSYAKLDNEGNVSKIEEKNVISNNAITGVYVFRSPSIFLDAISISSKQFNDFSYKGLLYISPILNTLIENNQKVNLINAKLDIDFSSEFKL